MRDPKVFSPWFALWVVVTVFAFAMLGCPTDSIIDDLANDTTAPVPGDSGTIVCSNETTTTVDLAWTTATDNETSRDDLAYRVYYSTSDNIDSATAARTNGVEATSANAIKAVSYQIASLTPDTVYYFVVTVADEAGNLAVYDPVSGSTVPTADVTAPVPGSELSLDSTSYNSITVVWTAATDDQDDASDLIYTLYYSETDDVSGVADAGDNGTEVDISSGSPVTIDSLSYGSTYYVNIIVEDSSDNAAEYGSRSMVTLDGPRIEVTYGDWSETYIAVNDYAGHATTATKTITITNNADADQALEIASWSVEGTTTMAVFSLGSDPPLEAIDPGNTADVVVTATTVGGNGSYGGYAGYTFSVVSNDPTNSSYANSSDSIFIDYS